MEQLLVRALVPKIPPLLKPAGDLSDFFILWEAKWEAVAPVDPILLRRVSESVFVVLAQWDLTPLERSVLETRTL
jgi:hypothetical protein